MVGAIDVIVTAANEGYMLDLIGLARRGYHNQFNLDYKIFNVASFIVNYEQMWHDVGNVDFRQQYAAFKGRQPLYSDVRFGQENPNVSASDFWYTLKEFMRTWAARKHEGSPERDWDKMQEEFADTFLRG